MTDKKGKYIIFGSMFFKKFLKASSFYFYKFEVQGSTYPSEQISKQMGKNSIFGKFKKKTPNYIGSYGRYRVEVHTMVRCERNYPALQLLTSTANALFFYLINGMS